METSESNQPSDETRDNSEIPSSSEKQLRPGLWDVVNERYPGSMIHNDDFVSMATLDKPLGECRLGFVSTSGVQSIGSMPFDVVHPVGDYTFRRVPSDTPADQLEIHQLKYPTDGANRDVNVVYPIERLREIAAAGVVGELTGNLYSFIGYNMDPRHLERTLAEDIADAFEEEQADVVLAAPA